MVKQPQKCWNACNVIFGELMEKLWFWHSGVLYSERFRGNFLPQRCQNMQQQSTSLCNELSDEYPNRKQILVLDWMCVTWKIRRTYNMEKKSCFPDFQNTLSSSQGFVVLQALRYAGKSIGNKFITLLSISSCDRKVSRGLWNILTATR
jgi:hypothetical protein